MARSERLTDGWARFIASRAARRATLVLLVLHVSGCAIDLATEQWWVRALMCLGSASDLAELLGLLAWLGLALSCAVGLLGLRFAPARPAYWALLAAIPIASLVQSALLERGVLRCDTF